MKILYITTIGSTMGFFKPFIKSLLDSGNTVDIATNEDGAQVPDCYREWGCKVHHIDTSRSPLSKGNLRAIKQIKKLVTEEHYDIVHCHTPMAAMCTRLACKKVRKTGTKVIYTAHGFHFYEGAPKKNWLIYYSVEKFCARYTDILITINQEDYALAKKKLKAKRIEYVPGVGIDLNKFGTCTVDKLSKRRELGIPEDAVLLLSVGELNENKNHETVIKAIEDIDAYYVIAGVGGKQEELQALIDSLSLQERVKLLGFRRDVGELCNAADVFVFPSFREGLSVALMESMASGLPCVVSRIRGNVDLIADGEGGFTVSPSDVDGFTRAISALASDAELRRSMGEKNLERIKDFEISVVIDRMTEIYEKL